MNLGRQPVLASLYWSKDISFPGLNRGTPVSRNPGRAGKWMVRGKAAKSRRRGGPAEQASHWQLSFFNF